MEIVIIFFQGIAILIGIFALLYATGKLRAVFDNLPYIDNSDPTRLCRMYVEEGCSHVDGLNCDMKTCTMLRDYNKDNGHT